MDACRRIFWGVTFLSFLLNISVTGSAVRTCQLMRCDHACQGNSLVGYQCECRNGYYLGDDGRTCHDDDECDDWKRAHGCEYNCVRTEGSYKCTCPAGHTMVDAPTGRVRCDDIDECEIGENKCEQICVNEPGSYHCACRDDFLLVNGHMCVKTGVSGPTRGPPRPDPGPGPEPSPALSPNDTLQSDIPHVERTGSGNRDTARSDASIPLEPRTDDQAVKPWTKGGVPGMNSSVPLKTLMELSLSMSSIALGAVLLLAFIALVIYCRRRKQYDVGGRQLQFEKERPAATCLQINSASTPEKNDDELYINLRMMELKKPMEEGDNGSAMTGHLTE